MLVLSLKNKQKKITNHSKVGDKASR